MSDEPQNDAPQEEQPVADPKIEFDDFMKVQLKVATVLEAKEHPNADKLIILQVDLGSEKRQICAGLRGHYEPEALVGKQVVVCTNLSPRKMRGEVSDGMVLAASGEDKSQVIVVGPLAEVPAGSGVS